MRAELINPFLSSTVNVIGTMCQTSPTAGKPCMKEGTCTWGAVTGIIGMAGETLTGNMMISFDEAAILVLVNRMLSETFTEINSDIVDAVGEMTNMICGGTKQQLSELGYQFKMATPIMITGIGVTITQLSKSPIIQVPFSIPEGKFVVEANLSERREN